MPSEGIFRTQKKTTFSLYSEFKKNHHYMTVSQICCLELSKYVRTWKCYTHEGMNKICRAFNLGWTQTPGVPQCVFRHLDTSYICRGLKSCCGLERVPFHFELLYFFSPLVKWNSRRKRHSRQPTARTLCLDVWINSNPLDTPGNPESVYSPSSPSSPPL